MPLQPLTADTCRAMLAHLSPDVPRDEWATVAMALKAELGDAGFDLFDAWSQRGQTYRAEAVRSTWRSIKASGGRTGATLVRMAKAAGWRPDAVQAPARRPTPAELKAQAAARRESEERERAATAKRQRAAAAEAARLWAGASESGASPYLLRKGVKAHGLRFLPDGSALVPMCDAAGELWNLQTIRPERPPDGAPEKLFLKGGRKSGLFHMLGEPEPEAAAAAAENMATTNAVLGEPEACVPWLLIAEGYATGASCHEATGRPVAVAFDAGNLVHVVRALRGRWPGARLLICGDDDAATAERTGKNPGRDKAAAAARLVPGTATAFPAFLDSEGEGRSDFNDLQAVAGLDAVHCMIEEAIAQAEADAERAAQGTEGRGTGKDATPAGKAPPVGRQRAARGTGGDGAAGGRGGDGTGGPGDPFRVDDDGLWHEPEGGQPWRICAPLHVIGLARDEHDNGAALLLRFDTPFRAGREWLLPLETLAGDGTAYRAALHAQGFLTPADRKRRELLTAYLHSRRPAELVRTVDRVGWHGRAFVMPDRVLGDDSGERLKFVSDAPIEATFGQRGTLDQWKARIAQPCIGNSRLVLAVSCAFAGPLLAWAAGTDGGGFHLVGDSSCGKTTALRVAASVWGGRRYLQRWRATDNGLEALAAQHSDGLLCLDELAQLDPKVAGESAYLLANGAGKSRASRSGTARPRLQWRLLFLSAGEVGLAEHMGEAGKRTRAGQELRMIDLPADAGCSRGIFEELHGHAGGGELARHLARACEASYGTAGRAWLEWLTDNADGLGAAVRGLVDAYEREMTPADASGQVERVARRLALVAAAGELATSEAGLTGWERGSAFAAVRRCFEAWLAARPAGAGMSEPEQMLRRVRLWIQRHGQSARFPDFNRRDDDRAPQPINQAGWRRALKTNHGMETTTGFEWFVFPEVFGDELCGGGDPRPMLRLLASLGHLHREKPDGFTCGLPVEQGPRQRVYRLRPSIIGDADE